jgi:chromosome segregation protein
MDEIDASLDHQNRERVAKFLREFSKDSQMVVITLHDTIAAVADRIFGVTKENGISRILSVDLSGLGD